MLLSSTIASAAAGQSLPSTRIIRELATEHSCVEGARVWFTQSKLPSADTARINALASDAAASDDSDLRNIVHYGAPLAAAALATADPLTASGTDILAAIVCGYEVAGRINDAVPNFQDKGFHGATLTIFAAAVAAGRMMRLNAEQMCHAIALSATSTGFLSSAANNSCAREYHAGQAVFNGVVAAQVAARGYQGEERILEMRGGFFETFGRLTGAESNIDFIDQLGSRWDIDRHLALKLMPGGHHHHALAEATGNAVSLGKLKSHQIQQIVVWRPGMTTLGESIHPSSLVEMAHSPTFFIAAAAVDGTVSWQHTDPLKISDAVIHSVIDRIVVGNEPHDSMEYRHGAFVTVVSTDGARFSSRVLAPAGAIVNLNWASVDAKFVALLEISGIPSSVVQRGLSCLHDFQEPGSLVALLDSLTPPWA